MSAAFQHEEVSSYQTRSMSGAFQHEEVSSYQNRVLLFNRKMSHVTKTEV